jgi:peptidoglycan-associated lipoprotein
MGSENLPPQDPGARAEGRVGDDKFAMGGPLGDVHFDYDSFELTAEARETLRMNADWMKSSVQSKIEVEGHCDDRGTAEYNLALGAKRAKSARDYIVSLGISPDRLSTISYGEELPLCREETESCWQENRRVHFLVLNR